MQRRDFLVRTGLAIGATAFARASRAAGSAERLDLGTWPAVRLLFELDPRLIHMTGFFLASHPRPVREAIERHRRALDAEPVGYFIANEERLEAAVLEAAADYTGGQPTDIALTDSTTMGLGLLYGGLKLRAGQEILTTSHDHYSTETSLRLRAERTGARVRQVPLYERPSAATEDEIVGRLVRAVRPETRFVAVTWVHSVSGVKLPIRAMADAIATLNGKRSAGDRVLFCVDGVHGFGVEDVRLPELGCDFFVAGCHKWIFGPRGTGLVWGRAEAWPEATATIPTFDAEAYQIWMGQRPARELPVSVAMTPGGFQAFEHRWALDEAFRLHLAIGKPRVAARIHELNTRLKDGLAAMPYVTLHTPRDEKLSAGIVCFEVAGRAPFDVARKLYERGIVASVTPYRTLYARLAPSLLTSTEDVDRALAEVGALAGGNST